MNGIVYADFFAEGVAVLKKGYTNQALACFEKAYRLKPSPEVTSHLGYCRAYIWCTYQEGIDLCQEAIGKEPDNPIHYLNLGKIYLARQQKKLAVETFRKALDLHPSPEITAELDRLGSRKPPVFGSLPRRHFLNKYTGLMLSRLGLR
jgi:tetratricopeptide (TPR) repeat protein